MFFLSIIAIIVYNNLNLDQNEIPTIFNSTEDISTIGLEENLKVAHAGGQVAKNTREDIENLLGESVINNKNKLSYQYVEEQDKIENK